MTVTVKQALEYALNSAAHEKTGKKLRLEGRLESRLECEVLLAHVLGRSRASLYTWPERELSSEEEYAFRQLLQRRSRGEPVAYLTGHREFWSLDLVVDPRVLIPRPETELLVELALSLAGNAAELRVADLGTGSGAIALALSSERLGWQVVACDRSAAALEVARCNAGRLGLENIDFRLGSWCDALPGGAFDLIVGNPPYIDPADPHLRQDELCYEPREALVAGAGGLADISLIAEQATGRLGTGGWLLLEHGYSQGEGVRDVLMRLGYTQVRTDRDLAGHERVTMGRRPLC